MFECARLGGPLRQIGETTKQVAAGARDRPFRIYDRVGSGRHAVEAPRSPRAVAEERFLTDLAAAIANEKFDELVLFAPPKALGILHQLLPLSASERIVLAAPKDYLHETTSNLARRLKALALESNESAGH